MPYYDFYHKSDEIPGSAELIRAKNRLVYGIVAGYLTGPAEVLEIGPGKGWFADLCREHGHRYHGVESDREACDALVAKGYEITCARVPPLTVDSPDGGYGMIYSAHLLEHLPGSAAVHELLSQCAGLTSPSGIVALLFPDAMAMGGHFWNCDYTHSFPTTERRVSQAMADAGLMVLESRKIRGHYTGGKRLLAGALSKPLALKVAQALALSDRRRDVFYRGWMYLQQDILLIARPA